MDPTQKELARVAAVEVASDVVADRVGVIEACRRLSTIAHDLVDDWRVDKDFVVIGAVNSETDSLPIGAVRQHWGTAALIREDAKIAAAEAAYRNRVTLACGNIIKRFADV